MDMLEKVKVKVQEPNVRNKNFKEVEETLTDKDAKKEASRCLHCNNPNCRKGCPVNIAIPDFIQEIKNNNIEKAYDIISMYSSLPAICGRVCPQEKQCEKMCIRGYKGESVAIGALERYVADWAIENKIRPKLEKEKNGKKVAIVGSGPAGLTCAGELAKEGFEVTIYEVLHKAGGVLLYGIPEFRLPKKIVQEEVKNLEKLGVNIITNVPIGNSLTIKELAKEYDDVFVATGAGLPKFMDIPGEEANGVYSANELLTRINLMKAYKKDAKTPIKKSGKAYVIGGGNVAMDTVRCLKRLGVDAHLMYRRSEDELPARKIEIEHAKEEGIIFELLKNPVKILTDENNNVTGMEVVDMELLEAGKDGRRQVKEIENSNHTVDCDMVVMALGTSLNHEALKGTSIKLNEKGLIDIDDNLKTSYDNVYAGGDAITGSATVILAMEEGRKAAKSIIEKHKIEEEEII